MKKTDTRGIAYESTVAHITAQTGEVFQVLNYQPVYDANNNVILETDGLGNIIPLDWDSAASGAAYAAWCATQNITQ